MILKAAVDVNDNLLPAITFFRHLLSDISPPLTFHTAGFYSEIEMEVFFLQFLRKISKHDLQLHMDKCNECIIKQNFKNLIHVLHMKFSCYLSLYILHI